MVVRRDSSPATPDLLVAGQRYGFLSLAPEWAWAVMFGGKDVENRGYSTPYRGRLIIHARSQRSSPDDLQAALDTICRRGQLSPTGLPTEFQRSAILGTVELVDCVENSRSAWAQRGLKNWVIRDPRPLARPLEGVKGHQTFKYWTPSADDVRRSSPPGATSRSAPSVAAQQPAQAQASHPPTEAARASEARSIDDLSSNEILIALRQVANAEPTNDVALLRAASRRLGFARMGSRVEDALKSSLRTAIRRRILAKDGGQITAATRSVDDYDPESLLGFLGRVIRRGATVERSEAARLLGSHLGFGESDKGAMRSIERVLDQAIARGVLASAGSGSVRRVA